MKPQQGKRVPAIIFVFAIVVATAAIGTRAEAQNYPWCALYDDGDEGKNCGFTTLEQCQADVSGIGGFCQLNNTYKPPAAAASSRQRAAKHHARKNS